MPFIDWERVAGGIEKAGAGWSASIRRELELKKAEARERRMFTFRLGEETKARKELMEEGKIIAMDLERDKSKLASELQMNLGSLEVGAFITEASKPGQIGPQMQAIGTRDLIGRLQRFERPKPEDIKLLQSLPLEVQSPISAAMGAVNKYYDKEDREKERFKKWGTYMDAQAEHMTALADALKMKMTGTWTPAEANKLLDSSTKALAELQKDEYFRLLSKRVADGGVESLKKDQSVQWKDYMKRYAYLQGAIKAASEVLYGKPEARPMPPSPEEAKEEGPWYGVAGEGIYAPLEKGRQAAMVGLGEAGKFIYDLLTKGWSNIKDQEIIGSFKKTFVEPFK